VDRVECPQGILKHELLSPAEDTGVKGDNLILVAPMSLEEPPEAVTQSKLERP
jgi:hypothetical protein